MQVITLDTKDSRLNLFFRFIKSNRSLLLLATVLLLGKLFGAISVKYLDNEFGRYVNEWFISSFEYKSTSDFWTMFLSNFIRSLTYILIILFFSFGISGVIAIPLILFIRGIGTCALSGVLYRNYSLQGIAYSNLILLPSGFAFDIVLLIFGCYAFDVSIKFSKLLRSSSIEQSDYKVDLLKMLRKSIYCVFVTLVISFADALFSVGFSQYFNFS